MNATENSNEERGSSCPQPKKSFVKLDNGHLKVYTNVITSQDRIVNFFARGDVVVIFG